MPHLLLLDAALAAAPASPIAIAGTIAVAFIQMLQLIGLAIIRRSNSKVTALSRAVGQHGTTLQELAKAIAELQEINNEHSDRLNQADDRTSLTEPHIKSVLERLVKLEHDLSHERSAREARREAQTQQDLELAKTLGRMDEALRNLSKQVETYARRR